MIYRSISASRRSAEHPDHMPSTPERWWGGGWCDAPISDAPPPKRAASARRRPRHVRSAAPRIPPRRPRPASGPASGFASRGAGGAQPLLRRPRPLPRPPPCSPPPRSPPRSPEPPPHSSARAAASAHSAAMGWPSRVRLGEAAPLGSSPPGAVTCAGSAGRGGSGAAAGGSTLSGQTKGGATAESGLPPLPVARGLPPRGIGAAWDLPSGGGRGGEPVAEPLGEVSAEMTSEAARGREAYGGDSPKAKCAKRGR